ncbi:MAG: hypothetical protein ABIP94_12870, partial [Planctomycetota bacterium]
MRGEIDWIVMKALDKDRLRRYQTATSLGDDVRRPCRRRGVRGAAQQPVSPAPPRSQSPGGTSPNSM